MNFEVLRLDDGGELTWPAGAQIVPVGDHGLPERMTYTHAGADTQPRLVIEMQVWEGVPVCAKMELTAKPDTGVQVRPLHLSQLARMVDPIIEMAGVRFGFSRTGPTGCGRAMPGSLDEQRTRLSSVRNARRKITPAFLQRVASTYQTAPTPKLEAIEVEFGCSERSAARYVTAARKAGLLDG